MRLGTFTPSVLLEVARSTGLLAKQGLEVVESPVTSSPSQFSALAARELDVVVTSPDNVLAYRFLAENPLGRLLDVVITAGLDADTGLSLCLRPGYQLGDDSKVTLGVDVPTSGFAFAAYALLDAAGWPPETYEVVALGSTPRRRAALAAGECDVTILGAGNELIAEAAGCTVLSTVPELGPYVGEVVARLAQSPTSEGADLLAEIFVDVADAIRAGEFAPETVAAAEAVLGLPRELAERHHARLAGPGLLPGGGVPTAALGTLVDLRRRYQPAPGLDDVADGLDALLVHRAKVS